MLRRHRITPAQVDEMKIFNNEKTEAEKVEKIEEAEKTEEKEPIDDNDCRPDAELFDEIYAQTGELALEEYREEEEEKAENPDVPQNVENVSFFEGENGEEQNEVSSDEQNAGEDSVENAESVSENAPEPMNVIDFVSGKRVFKSKPKAVRSLKQLDCFAYKNMSRRVEEAALADKRRNAESEAFIASIKRLDKESLANEENESRNKWLKSKALPYRIALYACIAIFIISAFMIAKTAYEGFKAERLSDTLENDFFRGLSGSALPTMAAMVENQITPPYGSERLNSVPSIIADKKSSNYIQIQAKLSALKNNNSDTYAWIKIDGTNISYVVCKGGDNSYYLDHTYTKKYNALGTIFADYRNGENITENRNTILYGHNVAYQSQMFHEIAKYTDKNFFDQNKYITLYTLDGILTYEVFSVYETLSSSNYIATDFINDNEFVMWTESMQKNSMFQRDIAPFKPTDRILTLSTCTNGISTHRYAVHARLVSIER